MKCSLQDTEGLNAASAQEAHVIKGKKVTCKKAEAKQGKIYVGKLPTEGVSVEDIQNYFAQVSFFQYFHNLVLFFTIYVSQKLTLIFICFKYFKNIFPFSTDQWQRW